MLEPAARVIMVSGASRGIGRAVVERLLAAGFQVSAGMRDPRGAAPHDPRALEAGGRVLAHRYDATEAGSAEAWVQGTLARFGALHGLVNVAGINPKAELLDPDETALDALWAVNVKAPMRLARLAMPHLAACGHGRVVNVASLSGKRVRNTNVGYAMSKFALVALTHGNETAGAAALDRMLRAGVRPARGRLTLGFANLDAFRQFDPGQPTATRFLDEDLNRLWDMATLEGSRSSRELERARAMRPLLEQADLLLDLHSMLWPSDPLMLSGPSAKGRSLAAAIGTPPLVVADAGHLGGRRLIDFAPFAEAASPRAAVLVEAGQHWQPDTVQTTLACVAGLLRMAEMLTPDPVWPEDLAGGPPRHAEVTMTVTAATSGFAFARPFRGGEVIAACDTLIARDGGLEVRTPYDDCLLVMPSLRPSRGHTAVRMARFL